MTAEQLIKCYQKELLTMEAYLDRYSGLYRLYMGACLANNGKDADQYRQQLHNMLDSMLDSVAIVQTLRRQIPTV